MFTREASLFTNIIHYAFHFNVKLENYRNYMITSPTRGIICSYLP